MHAELEKFLQTYPEIQMLEVLMTDMNGIPRAKRIPRTEFESFIGGQARTAASVSLLNTLGDFDCGVAMDVVGGDPDQQLRPTPGTLAPVPWLQSPTGQVMATFYNLDNSPGMFDPRNILAKTLESFTSRGLKPVVATELEFYLIEPGDDPVPTPKIGRVPGTNIRQHGIQYSMADDLWDNDAFLNDVRIACEQQSVPMTTIHSEFAEGQFEINVHHVDDPLLACDQAVLLKRIIKGVARKHGNSACFMAKPYAEHAGSGLHIHISIYDQQGNNIFHDAASDATPAISTAMRHAIGGLAESMGSSMAIFAPNANSYRRMVPGNFAPISTLWGYNHRDVSLRIPVSGVKDLRIEHRVAGADANPYLVMAAVLAGIDHGITNQCDPGEMVLEGQTLKDTEIRLPNTWEQALDAFDAGEVLPNYMGKEYCGLFSAIRRAECNSFRAQVSNIDYEWYLRAV